MKRKDFAWLAAVHGCAVGSGDIYDCSAKRSVPAAGTALRRNSSAQLASTMRIWYIDVAILFG